MLVEHLSLCSLHADGLSVIMGTLYHWQRSIVDDDAENIVPNVLHLTSLAIHLISGTELSGRTGGGRRRSLFALL